MRRSFDSRANPGGDGEHEADTDRREAIEHRHGEPLRRQRADEGDDEAQERRSILEQDDEGRRVLAPPQRLDQADVTLNLAEGSQSDQPSRSFKHR